MGHPDSPGRRHEPFPLTDIQHGYVLGRTGGLELGGVSSHFYFEFEGPVLDVPRLGEALDKVIARHDMLRPVIDEDGGQRVLERVPPYRIETTDLRGQTPDAQLVHLAKLRAELGDHVPASEQPPVAGVPACPERPEIRATVLADDRMRLHLSFDLLFIDTRGVFQLLSEWRRHYDDPEYAPETPRLTFRDYVLAHQELAADEVGRHAERYWLSRLDELPGAPELPLATAPEQLGRPSFGRRTTTLSAPRWAALTEAALDRGLTPESVLLAAYCEVLRAWSRRTDFTVTLSKLDRLPLHADVDDIVGNFLVPSLLAVEGDAGPTFTERAAAVRSRAEQDAAHQTFGGIRVLRELTRRQGRIAAMPVMFTSMLGAGGDALGLFGDLVHELSQTPQVWLENQVHDRDGGVVVTWNSVTGLFPAGMLDAMFHAYRTLLDRLVDERAEDGADSVWTRTDRVVELPAAQADERGRANATGADLPPVRLQELVGAAAERTPDAVAVVHEGAEVTYRQLTEQAHRIARRLRERAGAEPGSVVAVSMRAGAALFSALLGVLHAGAAYVSIDPELPEQRRHKLLARCGVRAVVTEPDLRESLSWPADVHLVTGEDPETLRQSADPVAARQDVDDLAYVIFTSGSTGEPKGVMITHRSAGNTVQDINQRFGVGRDDRVLALAPTGFDLSVYDVFGVLGAGGAVVLPSAGRTSDLAHWSELIDRHRVTIWNSVPAPMRLWVESLRGAARPPGNTLRLALLSGDWIPTTLPGQVREHFPELNVVSLGGATEGSIWSVCYPIGEVPEQWPSIPYGKPLANQTLHVLDDKFADCPTWATGEIHIGGVGVAAGYWGDPERSAQRFVVSPVTGERLYRTGDLGRYLPGGDIEILGRDDSRSRATAIGSRPC